MMVVALLWALPRLHGRFWPLDRVGNRLIQLACADYKDCRQFFFKVFESKLRVQKFEEANVRPTFGFSFVFGKVITC